MSKKERNEASEKCKSECLCEKYIYIYKGCHSKDAIVEEWVIDVITEKLATP